MFGVSFGGMAARGVPIAQVYNSDYSAKHRTQGTTGEGFTSAKCALFHSSSGAALGLWSAVRFTGLRVVRCTGGACEGYSGGVAVRRVFPLCECITVSTRKA